MTVKHRARGSEWDVFLRSIALLHRLLQGPATTDELINFACETVHEEIYPKSETAKRAAFKHDMAHLRNRLKAQTAFDKKTTKKYSLVNPGPFGMLTLRADSLRGLALLARDFGNGLGETGIYPCLDG